MSMTNNESRVNLIPLQFGLFWAGGPMSYLRYLTFKSLRHFHPHSKIELYISEEYVAEVNWFGEKQDFQDIKDSKNYIEELNDLSVEIKVFNSYGDFAPNFQSDFFRWWYLSEYGGFYLDIDQIITKSFHSLPLENDFIYSAYDAKSCNKYYPVGVVGCKKDSVLLKEVYDLLPQYADFNNYNSLGPNMFKSVYTSKKWRENHFNAPSGYFYPVPESYLVKELYGGETHLKAFKDSYACHWFGGHPLSQEFNKKYTEEFAQSSNDSLSVFMREKGII